MGFCLALGFVDFWLAFNRLLVGFWQVFGGLLVAFSKAFGLLLEFLLVGFW